MEFSKLQDIAIYLGSILGTQLLDTEYRHSGEDDNIGAQSSDGSVTSATIKNKYRYMNLNPKDWFLSARN